MAHRITTRCWQRKIPVILHAVPFMWHTSTKISFALRCVQTLMHTIRRWKSSSNTTQILRAVNIPLNPMHTCIGLWILLPPRALMNYRICKQKSALLRLPTLSCVILQKPDLSPSFILGDRPHVTMRYRSSEAKAG